MAQFNVTILVVVIVEGQVGADSMLSTQANLVLMILTHFTQGLFFVLFY